MRRAVSLATVALVVVGGLAWAQQPRSPYEAVIQEMLAGLGQMTKALEPVTDGPTAEAARPALKEAVDRFLKVRQKAEKLPQPGKAERDRMIDGYQRKLAEAVDRLRSQVRRVQAIPAARDILKELTPLEPSRSKAKEKPGS